MLYSPFSQKQLEESKRVVIRKVEDVTSKVYFDCIYIDRTGRHDHTVVWNRGVKDLKMSLECDCTACSNYEVFSRRWCIFKIAAARKLVSIGWWQSYVLKLIEGEE